MLQHIFCPLDNLHSLYCHTTIFTMSMIVRLLCVQISNFQLVAGKCEPHSRAKIGRATQCSLSFNLCSFLEISHLHHVCAPQHFPIWHCQNRIWVFFLQLIFSKLKPQKNYIGTVCFSVLLYSPPCAFMFIKEHYLNILNKVRFKETCLLEGKQK